MIAVIAAGVRTCVCVCLFKLQQLAKNNNNKNDNLHSLTTLRRRKALQSVISNCRNEEEIISKMAMHDNGVVVVVCSEVKEREMDVCLASSG